jgi:hypothetical protein
MLLIQGVVEECTREEGDKWRGARDNTHVFDNILTHICIYIYIYKPLVVVILCSTIERHCMKRA